MDTKIEIIKQKNQSTNLIRNKYFIQSSGLWVTSYPDWNLNYIVNDISEDGLTSLNMDPAGGLRYEDFGGNNIMWSSYPGIQESEFEVGKSYDITLIVDTYEIAESEGHFDISINLGNSISATFNPAVDGATFSTSLLAADHGGLTIIIQVQNASYANILLKSIKVTESNSITELDLYSNVGLPITYSISDIRTPDKRDTSYSKTLLIPGTKNNNLAFNNIFDINAESQFNPNKKVDVIVSESGIQTFTGILQLKSINKINDVDIDYSVVLFGSIGDLFLTFGDHKIDELDFSRWNHIYDIHHVTQSWVGGIYEYNKTLVYNPVGSFTYIDSYDTGQSFKPFIDTFYSTKYNGYLGLVFDGNHGYSVGDFINIQMNTTTINPEYNGMKRVFNIVSPTELVVGYKFGRNQTLDGGIAQRVISPGYGYTYPMIEYGHTDGNNYLVNNLFPALYVKEYIDKMFEFAGYTYSSTFFDSELFRRLIVPFNGKTIKYVDDSFRASVPYDYTVSPMPAKLYSNQYNKKISLVDETNGSNHDARNVWDGQKYIVNDLNASYSTRLEFNIDFGIKIINKYAVSYTWTGDIYATAYLMKRSTVGGITSTVYITVDSYTITMVADGTSINPGDSYTVYNQFRFDKYISTSPNEEYWVVLLRDISQAAYVNIFDFTTPANIDLIIRSSSFVEGNVKESGSNFMIEMNSCIPKDVTMSSFFKSLITMFNLQISIDKDNSKLLHIEKYKDFYDAGTTIDWTDKMDIKSSIVTPLPELTAKSYEFNYQSDSDFGCKEYESMFLSTWGSSKYTTDNDFITNINKSSIIFGGSPNADYTRASKLKIHPNYSDKAIGRKDGGNNVTKPKILIWVGMKALDSGWGLRYDNQKGIARFGFYPYAGHEDDPNSPSIDINFGYTAKKFYADNNTRWTNNNLFNSNYSNFIQSVTDKNSKMLTASFNLTPYDIFNLDFRNNITIRGTKYRLNKIYDFDISNNGLTKVDLIKITQKPEFVQLGGKLIDNSTEIFNGSGRLPSMQSNVKYNGNTYNGLTSPTLNTLQGSGNSIDTGALGSNINGDNNTVGLTDRVNIFGSNNTVGGSASDIFVVGNNVNVSVFDSGSSYISGVKIQNGSITMDVNMLEGGFDEVQNPFNTVVLNNIVDGGKDCVREMGSNSIVNIIDGNTLNINES